MEVCNSFELVVESRDGSSVLDKEYFIAKEEQCECMCVHHVIHSDVTTMFN